MPPTQSASCHRHGSASPHDQPHWASRRGFPALNNAVFGRKGEAQRVLRRATHGPQATDSPGYVRSLTSTRPRSANRNIAFDQPVPGPLISDHLGMQYGPGPLAMCRSFEFAVSRCLTVRLWTPTGIDARLPGRGAKLAAEGWLLPGLVDARTLAEAGVPAHQPVGSSAA
jgi:hypothetical protein